MNGYFPVSGGERRREKVGEGESRLRKQKRWKKEKYFSTRSYIVGITHTLKR
jgi:hypothetical protein